MSEKNNPIFKKFIEKNRLNEKQAEQFDSYIRMLREYNEHSNLTTVTDTAMIIKRHFQDSLAVCSTIDCQTNQMMVDVGSGGGFPGIPLKIAFPHLKIVLIEVTHKKIIFLQQVINQLKLDDIEIYPHDWRTFLRKTSLPISYFLARASLEIDELLRIFKPFCSYKSSKLIYWASRHWRAHKEQQIFIERTYSYQIDALQRLLIFFSQPLQERLEQSDR